MTHSPKCSSQSMNCSPNSAIIATIGMAKPQYSVNNAPNSNDVMLFTPRLLDYRLKND